MNSWPILKPIATGNINYQETVYSKTGWLKTTWEPFLEEMVMFAVEEDKEGGKKYKIEIIP